MTEDQLEQETLGWLTEVGYNLDFAHCDFVGKARVLLSCHPIWAGRRLGPAHKTVACAQQLATPKVGGARSILLKRNSTSTPLAICMPPVPI